MTKILVIEDAKDLREDIIEMLGLEGFEAVGAENGVVGIDKAQTEHPNLIVCDIMMPEKDGYEVLEVIRKNPETATIPFIFLTAKTERVNMRQGMILGADDYITKPFLVAELRDSIRSQLKKREDQDEAARRHIDYLTANIITALPHELRTPLNTIIGFSEMMQMEAQRLKPDQIAGWSGHINQAANRLYRVIENYLYYVKLQVAVENKDVSDDVLERVSSIESLITDEATRQAAQENREDDLQLDVANQGTLRISYQDANKIITELVSNAFKFSEAGQAVRVSGALADDGMYEIIVQDEGIGLESNQVQNIGAYMQFNRWLNEQQGMGLGLAVVKLLVELHSGALYITGEKDKGTVVKVKLPVV